jgi:hypothetical protein
MDAVETNPELLGHLSPEELGSVVLQTKDKLSGKNFGTLLGALGKVNPAGISGLVNSLKQAGSLGEFIQKLAAEGVNLMQMLKGIDFGAAMGLIKALAGAGDFLSKLQNVVDKARVLGTSLGEFDPLGPFKALEEELKS